MRAWKKHIKKASNIRSGCHAERYCPSGCDTAKPFISKTSAWRDRAMMKAVDKVNSAWGEDTIIHGVAGIDRPWSMRRAKLSRRYTTS